MAKTTRAAIQTARGEPLIIDEVELGNPRPDQVMLKLLSTGVCHSQIHELTDLRARPTAFGHEATAVVTEVGAEVTRAREGDHVIVNWVGHNPLPYPQVEEPCGATYRGKPIPLHQFTWSDDSIMSERYVVPIDKSEPTDLSCIVGCAVLTGCGAVIHTTKVRPGESVAVVGMGGVGLSALRAAALSLANPVIAVDIHPDKFALAREFGATHTVDSSREDPVEAIRDLSGGGVDYAFDAVGARAVTEMILKVTRPGGPGADHLGGTAVLIGVPGNEMTLDPRTFLSSQGRFVASFGATYPDEDFPMYLRWHRDGKFPLDKLVTDRYRLEDINDACDALKAGRIEGRAIIEL